MIFFLYLKIEFVFLVLLFTRTGKKRKEQEAFITNLLDALNCWKTAETCRAFLAVDNFGFVHMALFHFVSL